jgi:hypothetical protein
MIKKQKAHDLELHPNNHPASDHDARYHEKSRYDQGSTDTVLWRLRISIFIKDIRTMAKSPKRIDTQVTTNSTAPRPTVPRPFAPPKPTGDFWNFPPNLPGELRLE